MAGFKRLKGLSKGANCDPKIKLMRGALARANYKSGMGGLPKCDAQKPKPITLPKMPWDERK